MPKIKKVRKLYFFITDFWRQLVYMYTHSKILKFKISRDRWPRKYNMWNIISYDYYSNSRK